jgi:hypothetical protein
MMARPSVWWRDQILHKSMRLPLIPRARRCCLVVETSSFDCGGKLVCICMVSDIQKMFKGACISIKPLLCSRGAE